jgi:hypothetical protein
MGLLSAMLPLGEINVVAPGTTGVGVVKLKVLLQGPYPTLFQVCTFQANVPIARLGVAPATEQVVPPQIALSYHFVNVYPAVRSRIDNTK